MFSLCCLGLISRFCLTLFCAPEASMKHILTLVTNHSISADIRNCGERQRRDTAASLARARSRTSAKSYMKTVHLQGEGPAT